MKSTVDQLKERLQAAAIAEAELKAEINGLQKERNEQGHNVLAGQDKMKYLQKSLTNSDNERRVLAERLETAQATINELRRSQQSQQDQLQRLQESMAEMEVQKSALESQLRISKWHQETNDQMQMTTTVAADPLAGDMAHHTARQLQRDKSELRNTVDSLTEKVRTLETEKRQLERRCFESHHHRHGLEHHNKYDSSGLLDSNRLETESILSRGEHTHSGYHHCGLDHQLMEQENRDLRLKVRKLEHQLMEKETELSRLRTKLTECPKSLAGAGGGGTLADIERYRAGQLQAERLLEARDQSNRQQVLRLENQISMLREQLAQEAKRRQHYILKSTKTGREMQQLRQTLGDSLRQVANDPLDSHLLDSEARRYVNENVLRQNIYYLLYMHRLDTAMTMSSLPPASSREYGRSGVGSRK